MKLLLDVAHYKQGGGDPAVAAKKYAESLLFVHFKDVKPIESSPGYEFVELGQETVDLFAAVAALRAIHFHKRAARRVGNGPQSANLGFERNL